MAKSNIARVFGKADAFDLEFTTEDGGATWKCDVPPDTGDGVYAVEVTAVDAAGQIAHWTGELYMVNRVCKVNFAQPNYTVWFSKHQQGGALCMNDKQLYSITFFAGEERVVDSSITSCNPLETVVIRQATFKLTDRTTGEIIQSGDCEVNGSEMTVLIGTDISGFYLLEVTAKVGRETVKQRVCVNFL